MKVYGRALRVVIDPGHGGADSGAVGLKGTHEEKIVLLVAQRLKKELERAGVQVDLTRNSDVALQLSQRTGLAKQKKADLFVSLHNNAAAAREATGIEVLAATGDVNAQKFGKAVLDQVMKKFPLHKNRGLKLSPSPGYKRSIYVVRNAPCPSCLVEMEFISNQAMENWLLKEETQQQFAEAIAAGIYSYARANLKAID